MVRVLVHDHEYPLLSKPESHSALADHLNHTYGAFSSSSNGKIGINSHTGAGKLGYIKDQCA
jgi:hypothetical protein